MSEYLAPTKDMNFVLFDVLKADEYWQQNDALSEAIDKDTAQAIIEEAAKITGEVIAPLQAAADRQGVSFKDGEVTTPDGFKEAYKTYAEGGWVGLTGDVEYGGMGMPKSLATVADEMMCAADVGFSLYPGLTAGATLSILNHASDELKALYLPKMYSGEWSGSMCLTESHCGTDLGIMRTQAVPNDDGTYNITGNKIFISAGEHDLTENIVHLVLAKLPDAPAGSRGISLFIVPKFHVDAQGNLGERNQAFCGSIEHKMGIHSSATCVMNFDGATGYLVGEENKGLAAMFTMMNYERIAVGSQGIGCADRSYQNALAYAKDRVQGKGIPKTDAVADSIIVHPDVRRMLLNMKALTEGGRAFSAFVAMYLDKAKYDADPEAKKLADGIGQLLTPIAKAFETDMGFDTAVLGQQVLGGHGFISEWGMEQLVRDVRIAQIYEGTNGIQALDLMGRKIAANRGENLSVLLKDISMYASKVEGSDTLKAMAIQLIKAVGDIADVSKSVLTKAGTNPNEIGAASVDYLHALGYVMYGYMWLQMAAVAEEKHDEDPAYMGAKVKTAKYFFAKLLPRTQSHIALINAGADVLFEMDVEEF